MSDLEEKSDSRIELLMNKLTTCNKNLKLVLDTIKTIDDKLDTTLNLNMAVAKVNGVSNNNDREKMDEIFAKKGLGRPVGSYESKRNSYFEMVSNSRIKQPKKETLEYYRIGMDKDGKYYLFE